MDKHIRHLRAFTLIELLVVITIVGVMVALLIPSLAQARQAALGLKCQANQKQFGFALTTYSHDWYGIIPGWRYGWPRSKSIPRYFGVTTGVQAGKLVKCPASPFLADNYSQQFTYFADYFTNIRETRAPSEAFWVCDTPSNNGTASYTNVENITGASDMWFGHPNTKANLLFLDCHAGAWRQEEIPVLNDTGGFRHPGYIKFWRPFTVPTKVATGFPFSGVGADPWLP